MKIKFKRWECTIEATYYNKKDRKALMLMDGEELVAVATVNMPGYPCEDNQIYVKDYSENAGMLQTLIDNEIVFPEPADNLGGDFVTIPLMNLTTKGMKLWK